MILVLSFKNNHVTESKEIHVKEKEGSIHVIISLHYYRSNGSKSA